jgi:hypothetical protein
MMLKQFVNNLRGFFGMVVSEGAEYWRNRNNFDDATLSKRHTFLAGGFWTMVFYIVALFAVAAL